MDMDWRSDMFRCFVSEWIITLSFIVFIALCFIVDNLLEIVKDINP